MEQQKYQFISSGATGVEIRKTRNQFCTKVSVNTWRPASRKYAINRHKTKICWENKTYTALNWAHALHRIRIILFPYRKPTYTGKYLHFSRSLRSRINAQNCTPCYSALTSFGTRKAVMCPSHFCRVRVTSLSSQSHLKICRVESWLGRVNVESYQFSTFSYIFLAIGPSVDLQWL